MKVDEISGGLWRWTGWCEPIEADAGCVYQEGADGIVLIDPLVPPEDEARFFEALDLDVEHVLVSHGDPVLTRGRDALRAALSPLPAP